MAHTLDGAWAEPQCDHSRIQVSVHRPRVSSAIARFMLGSLAAIAVTVIGGFFVLRSIEALEAERDTRERVQGEGRRGQIAGLSDGIFTGARRSLAQLDNVVQTGSFGESPVGLK